MLARFLLATSALVLSACGNAGVEGVGGPVPQRLTVELTHFKPLSVFDGNQFQIWTVYDFRIINGPNRGSLAGRSNIRVVEVVGADSDFDRETLALVEPVSTERCPILRTDGTRYDIEVLKSSVIGRDVNGAKATLRSCRRAVSSETSHGGPSS